MLDLGEQSWYALHVRSKSEQTVAHGLDQLGVQRFLPTYKIRSGSTKILTWIEKPLFPGYVFCHLNLTRGPKLYVLPGLIRIVSTGKFPARVSDEDIESVRRIVTGNVPVTPYPYLNQGDEVVVIDGPLKGIAGIYLRAEMAGSLIVSLPLLCRSVNVRVDDHWVRPLRQSSARFQQRNDISIAS